MVYETSAGSLDICRKARDKWMKMMSVAFTGHRTILTNKYALSVSLNEEAVSYTHLDVYKRQAVRLFCV